MKCDEIAMKCDDSPLNMNTHLLIDSYPYTVKLLYLAFLYLAESVILMPSPRNHILDVFNLAAALSGNGQSAKSKFFTTSTSLIPKFKVQISAAVVAGL